MSLALIQRIKSLEAEVKSLREGKAFPDDLMPRIRDLENRYRMLNARLNKKNNNAETDGLGTKSPT